MRAFVTVNLDCANALQDFRAPAADDCCAPMDAVVTVCAVQWLNWQKTRHQWSMGSLIESTRPGIATCPKLASVTPPTRGQIVHGECVPQGTIQ